MTAQAKIEADDILAIAEATMVDAASAQFDAANDAAGRLQNLARDVVNAAETPERQSALEGLREALEDLRQVVFPIGQSVARTITLSTLALLEERGDELRAKNPITVNALEMHLASLIMSIRRRMISGRMPVALSLIGNLAALRAQLPEPATPDRAAGMNRRPAFLDVNASLEDDDDGPGRVNARIVQKSWTEKLADRLMGR